MLQKKAENSEEGDGGAIMRPPDISWLPSLYRQPDPPILRRFRPTIPPYRLLRLPAKPPLYHFGRGMDTW